MHFISELKQVIHSLSIIINYQTSPVRLRVDTAYIAMSYFVTSFLAILDMEGRDSQQVLMEHEELGPWHRQFFAVLSRMVWGEI